MRLFVAVDVPEDVKEALDHDVCDVLRPSLEEARWTRPEGRHLTLKFLGEVPEERVGELGRALETAAAGHAPFAAAFGLLGGFPNMRRPRVLWVGLEEGEEPMAALAASVERSLEPLGFPPEGRPFRGHLTLCRFKVPKPVGELPRVDVPAHGFEVHEIVLFRSQLHPKGARYTALERYPLPG